jgi:serine/threonine-protein kinase haspin
LSTKLINSKGLKPPKPGRTATKAPQKSATSAVWSEKECWEALVEIERMLGQRVEFYRSVKKSTGKGRRKVAIPVQDSRPRSARDVKEFGLGKGWISG